MISLPARPRSYYEYLLCKWMSLGSAPPKFIVAGTGRSGTAKIAEMLSAAGIPCGHESIHTPWGICNRADIMGDSSWLAVPSLGRFRGYVVHTVRNPRMVTQSLLDIGFFHEMTNNPHTRFARRVLRLSGNPVEDAYRWYFEWNGRIEKFAHVRFRLDQSMDLVNTVAQRLSISIRDGDAVADMREIPANRKDGAKQRTHLAELAVVKDRQLRLDIEAMANRYGFDMV